MQLIAREKRAPFACTSQLTGASAVILWNVARALPEMSVILLPPVRWARGVLATQYQSSSEAGGSPPFLFGRVVRRPIRITSALAGMPSTARTASPMAL